MATSSGGVLAATGTVHHRADDATQQTFRAPPDARVTARADPGSWLAVDAAPERDDLRAATRVTDVGSYR